MWKSWKPKDEHSRKALKEFETTLDVIVNELRPLYSGNLLLKTNIAVYSDYKNFHPQVRYAIIEKEKFYWNLDYFFDVGKLIANIDITYWIYCSQSLIIWHLGEKSKAIIGNGLKEWSERYLSENWKTKYIQLPKIDGYS